MATIFILIAVILGCGGLTIVIVKGSQKVKTMKPIKFNIPKISFPKIKLPELKLFKKKPSNSLTILTANESDTVYQEDLDIECVNGEYRRKPKTTFNSNIFGTKNWWLMAGVVVIGVMAVWFFYKWKLKK